MLLPAFAQSEPAMDSLELQRGVEHGSSVVIRGSGFSGTDSPAPVFFDFGDWAFVNGVRNTHHMTFDEGQAIQRPPQDPDTLWEKASFSADPDNAVNAPVIVRSRPARSKNSSAHYLMESANSFLGWPTAYGGSKTPVDNPKLYVSWFTKFKYNPYFYWSASPEEAEGAFIPGEEILINGIGGKFIGVAAKGSVKSLNQFIIDDQINANNLRGEIIEGLKSGATARFPSTFAGGTGVGFESPGSNKWLRVWEHPHGKEGLRLSWGNLGYADIGDEKNVKYKFYGEKWLFMELFIDTDAKVSEVYVDRELVERVDFEAEGRSAFSGEWSPTVALLGFNGKLQVQQVTEVDDIYLDSKFSRVVVGANDKFEELSSYELQKVDKWHDNLIELNLNLGAFDDRENLYIYVIKEDGSVNRDGFPLCRQCKTSPSPVPLNID